MLVTLSSYLDTYGTRKVLVLVPHLVSLYFYIFISVLQGRKAPTTAGTSAEATSNGSTGCDVSFDKNNFYLWNILFYLCT